MAVTVWYLIWKSCLVVMVAIVLVRITGRKSVAQMTVAATVVMISIGDLLAMGAREARMLHVWHTLGTVATFLFLLITLEFVELKSSFLQNLLSGKSVTVIRDGRIDRNALKRLRLTENQLIMRLRQKGLSNPSDIRLGTIEVNGEFGYELMPDAQPVTVKDLERLLREWKNKDSQG